MLLTDIEIKQAIKDKAIVIENVNEESFKSVAYIARVGKTCLISGQDKEIDVAAESSVTLNPGDLALFMTAESFKLSDTISGHIGIRSEYARKGVVLLAGMHIDPRWEGYLLIGVYNSSLRKVVLDYLDGMIIIEFHKLNKPPSVFARNSLEQKEGRIPKKDKDYLRSLGAISMSQVTADIRELKVDVKSIREAILHIEKEVKKIWRVMGVGMAFISLLVVILKLY